MSGNYTIAPMQAPEGAGIFRRAWAVKYYGLTLATFDTEASAEYWLAVKRTTCHCALPRGTCQACRQRAANAAQSARETT